MTSMKRALTKNYLVTGKLTGEEDDLLTSKGSSGQEIITPAETTTTVPPTRSTSTTETVTVNTTEEAVTTTEVPETETVVKPKPRLLNLNVDDLQTFANALHNQTNKKEIKKPLTDLSDVNLDGDDDEDPKMLTEPKHKQISDKFYSNLQAPFHPLLGVDRTSGETDIWCKENGVSYKVLFINHQKKGMIR